MGVGDGQELEVHGGFLPWVIQLEALLLLDIYRKEARNVGRIRRPAGFRRPTYPEKAPASWYPATSATDLRPFAPLPTPC